MIQEAYVSFEVAKLLKDKGFDIPTWTFYIENEIFHYNYTSSNSELVDEVISAPTHQMVCAWLRERKIDIIVFHERLPEDCYWARIEKYPYTEHQQEPIYQTYEEAVEAACLYVLNNLI